MHHVFCYMVNMGYCVIHPTLAFLQQWRGHQSFFGTDWWPSPILNGHSWLRKKTLAVPKNKVPNGTITICCLKMFECLSHHLPFFKLFSIVSQKIFDMFLAIGNLGYPPILDTHDGSSAWKDCGSSSIRQQWWAIPNQVVSHVPPSSYSNRMTFYTHDLVGWHSKVQNGQWWDPYSHFPTTLR